MAFTVYRIAYRKRFDCVRRTKSSPGIIHRTFVSRGAVCTFRVIRARGKAKTECRRADEATTSKNKKIIDVDARDTRKTKKRTL